MGLSSNASTRSWDLLSDVTDRAQLPAAEALVVVAPVAEQPEGAAPVIVAQQPWPQWPLHQPLRCQCQQKLQSLLQLIHRRSSRLQLNVTEDMGCDHFRCSGSGHKSCSVAGEPMAARTLWRTPDVWHE